MSHKAELIRLASEMKSLADRLLDCAKEDDKEESDEGEKDIKEPKAFMGAILKEKMEKYK